MAESAASLGSHSPQEPPRPPPPVEPSTDSGQVTDVIALDVEPAFQKSLPSALGGIAAAYPKRLGGDVAATMITASMYHLERELHESREDCKVVRGELTQALGEAARHRERASVLDERAASFAREKRTANICVLAGTAILGVGIDLLRGNAVGLGVVLALAGVALMVAGLFAIGQGAGA